MLTLNGRNVFRLTKSPRRFNLIQKGKTVSLEEFVMFLKSFPIIACKGIILGLILAILLSISSTIGQVYILLYCIAVQFLISLIIFFIKKEQPKIGDYDKRFFIKFTKKEILVFSIFFLILISPMYVSGIMKSVVESYEKSGYFEDIAKSVFENKTDDVSKVKAILKWQEENMLTSNTYGNSYQILFSNIHIITKPLKICIRLSGHENPKWTLISKCGACEEDALAFMELAKLGNITVRSIHMHGEDHNFDEVLVNGSWIIADPTQRVDKGYNVPLDFFENAWKLNISYAYAIYPNDTVEDVTYRYTNTSNLTLFLKDGHNYSVENATVLVFSNNRYDHRFTNLSCVTDSYGTCKFILGDGNYSIEAKKDLLFGEVRVGLEPGADQELTLNVKENYLKYFEKAIGTSQLTYIILFTIISYILLILIKLYVKL